MFPEWLSLFVRLSFGLGSMRGSRLTVRATSSGLRGRLRIAVRFAERCGYTVDEVYVDDDISAWSGKPRPEFQRMLDDLRRAGSGQCWPGISTGLPASARAGGVHRPVRRAGRRAWRVTGDVDLGSHIGRLTARMLGGLARYESDHKSERIRRKHEEIAAERARCSGGGSRPYGYESDKVTIRAAEAAIVRECAKRLLAGEPVRSIARDLNERGVTPRAAATGLRRVCGGCSLHRGSAASGATRRDRRQSEWPAIIARRTAQIRSRLANPERRTNKSRAPLPARRSARVQPLRRTAGRPPRSGGKRRYACAKGPGFSGCGRTYITADDVERFVIEAVLIPARLGRAPASERAAAGRAPDAQRWLEERNRRRRSRSSSPPPTGSREISMDELRAAREADRAAPDHRPQAARQAIPHQRARRLRRQRRRAPCRAGTRSTSASSTRSSPPSLDHVVVGPARRGYNRFDESRLTPVWRA